MKRIKIFLAVALIAFITGCSTATVVKKPFPEPPGSLMVKAEPLKPL